MKNIRFISYDGKYPTLCGGTLILDIDNKEYWFTNCLISTGNSNFNNIDDYIVIKNKWKFNTDYNSNYQDELSSNDINIIEQLINDNIEWGCCGGCY